MRFPLLGLISTFALLGALALTMVSKTSIAQEAAVKTTTSTLEEKAIDTTSGAESSPRLSRLQVLVGSLTVFTLAVLVGFEIIAKVPPTLHTPLMSGSNAISGITIVGAILAAGNAKLGFASFLGLLALILANTNVVGGFMVTHRMLLMFKKK